MTEPKKKVVYIDMDDTLADFFGATHDPVTGSIKEYMMWDKDFFLNLQPLPGSKGAVYELEKMGYDVYILSQPLAESYDSYSDKVKWIQLHFPTLYGKIVLTQNKGLCIGDFLIDDNPGKWKDAFQKNGGVFVWFDYGGHTYAKDRTRCPDPSETWRSVVQYFKGLV